MRKVDDGKKEKKKEKRKEKREKNGVFSGHYIIASSLPPKRRLLERRMLVPKKVYMVTKISKTPVSIFWDTL